MSYSSKVIWLIIIGILVAFSACAPTETVTTDEPDQEDPASQKYPSWFNSGGFSSDSLSYYGFGTAISSDSVIAIANAKLKANAVLEDHVEELMEDARKKLQNAGELVVADKEFLIMFRNAHNKIDEVVNTVNRSAKYSEGYYRGFSHITISKEQLNRILESGFQEKSEYWQLLKSSEEFEKLLN